MPCEVIQTIFISPQQEATGIFPIPDQGQKSLHKHGDR